MNRTLSFPIIIGLLLLCRLTPSIADESLSDTNHKMLQGDGDVSAETNDINAFPTVLPSESAPSSSSSLVDNNPSNENSENNNSTNLFYSPKATPEEYEFSIINKVIGFIFGGVIMLSVLLLIRNNREHAHQLAALRQQQQERRLRDETRRTSTFRDARKKEFHRRFHFTVIADDKADGGSKILSAKQPHSDNQEGSAVDADHYADVEAHFTEGADGKNEEEDDADGNLKCHPCVERRPSSSTAANHHHFWGNFFSKKHQHKEECSICLGDYCPGDTICVARASKCNHVFHPDCIAEWLQNHNECPLCRVNLMSAEDSADH